MKLERPNLWEILFIVALAAVWISFCIMIAMGESNELGN